MAADVDIVNYALSLLGDQPITDLTDDTVRARLANGMYAMNRDAALRDHPWSFAVRRATLSTVTPAPAFGWSYAFQLPTDPYCLRVLALNDDEEGGLVGDTFKIEGRTLMTNTSTAQIRYIARITDASQFDSLFAEALSCRLASLLAYPITGSVSASQAMFQLYQERLKGARSVNGQEGSPDQQNVTTLLDVR